MSQQHCQFDASRSLTALEQDSTIIAVIEMSQSKWLVAALVPGVERQPLMSATLDRPPPVHPCWSGTGHRHGPVSSRLVLS
jgi:hypothetical protein